MNDRVTEEDVAHASAVFDAAFPDAWGTLPAGFNSEDVQRFQIRRVLEDFNGRRLRSGRVAPSVPGRLPEIVCDDRVGLGELWIVDPVTEGVIGKIENLAREDVRFSAEGEARGQSTPISHSAEADRG